MWNSIHGCTLISLHKSDRNIRIRGRCFASSSTLSMTHASGNLIATRIYCIGSKTMFRLHINKAQSMYATQLLLIEQQIPHVRGLTRSRYAHSEYMRNQQFFWLFVCDAKRCHFFSIEATERAQRKSTIYGSVSSDSIRTHTSIAINFCSGKSSRTCFRSRKYRHKRTHPILLNESHLI